MAGLDPAIPIIRALCLPKRDARVKPAHDDESIATRRYAGTSASTRSGLPEPFSIFSGAVISTAPVAGN